MFNLQKCCQFVVRKRATKLCNDINVTQDFRRKCHLKIYEIAGPGSIRSKFDSKKRFDDSYDVKSN